MGVGLLLSIINGDLSLLSPAASFGRYITAGATIALVTVLVAIAVVAPSANKILRIVENLAKNPGPPPPELAKVSRRLRMGTTSVLVLLVVVLVFMVGAAWG
jgi:hypothetical protein